MICIPTFHSFIIAKLNAGLLTAKAQMVGLITANASSWIKVAYVSLDVFLKNISLLLVMRERFKKK